MYSQWIQNSNRNHSLKASITFEYEGTVLVSKFNPHLYERNDIPLPCMTDSFSSRSLVYLCETTMDGVWSAAMVNTTSLIQVPYKRMDQTIDFYSIRRTCESTLKGPLWSDIDQRRMSLLCKEEEVPATILRHYGENSQYESFVLYSMDSSTRKVKPVLHIPEYYHDHSTIRYPLCLNTHSTYLLVFFTQYRIRWNVRWK